MEGNQKRKNQIIREEWRWLIPFMDVQKRNYDNYNGLRTCFMIFDCLTMETLDGNLMVNFRLEDVLVRPKATGNLKIQVIALELMCHVIWINC